MSDLCFTGNVNPSKLDPKSLSTSHMHRKINSGWSHQYWMMKYITESFNYWWQNTSLFYCIWEDLNVIIFWLVSSVSGLTTAPHCVCVGVYVCTCVRVYVHSLNHSTIMYNERHRGGLLWSQRKFLLNKEVVYEVPRIN